MKKSSKKFNKNIIFFCPSIEEGGVEKNLINICNGIVERHKVTLITANKNKYIFFKKRINFISPNTNFFNNRSRFFKSLICVYLLIKYSNSKKDLIFSFQSNIIAIILAIILKRKIIIRSNASPNFYANSYLKRKFFSFFFSFADKILVNSKDFKKEFFKYFKLSSEVIYNPVEKIQKIKIKASKKVSLKFFNKDKKILKIISVGRLVKQKNHLLLLKAVNIIKNKKKFKLLIIGKGEEKENLESFIIKNNLQNMVKIIGYKNNIYPFFKKADLFVLTSLYEGLPNTLIEALIMGVPIISTNCKTGPEEILKQGKYGRLFNVNDFKKLSQLIRLSRNKSRKKYFYDKRFDFVLNLKKYENLINSLQ